MITLQKIPQFFTPDTTGNLVPLTHVPTAEFQKLDKNSNVNNLITLKTNLTIELMFVPVFKEFNLILLQPFNGSLNDLLKFFQINKVNLAPFYLDSNIISEINDLGENLSGFQPLGVKDKGLRMIGLNLNDERPKFVQPDDLPPPESPSSQEETLEGLLALF